MQNYEWAILIIVAGICLGGIILLAPYIFHEYAIHTESYKRGYADYPNATKYSTIKPAYVDYNNKTSSLSWQKYVIYHTDDACYILGFIDNMNNQNATNENISATKLLQAEIRGVA